LLNALKAWKLGAHRITAKQIEKLSRIKPKGWLVGVTPSLEDKPTFSSLPNFLIPLYAYKKHACFEIWIHQNRISFYIFAREEKLLEEIKAQLSALYPNIFFKDAESTFIPLKAGSYVCASYLSLDYYYCKIKSIQDFDYDPLTHILESLSIDAMLQVAFKAKKISTSFLERLKAKLDPGAPYTHEILRKFCLPCFKVIVRLAAFSESLEDARRGVETLANAFSSFNGSYARFKPRIVSFPILKNSYSILKDIVKRKFPFIDFNKSFILSSEELATLFHLPIKIKDERINYTTRPRLPLPPIARKGNGITIGFLKQYRRGREQASIPLSDLTRHVYIIGSSGTGKTSLLVNIIAQAQEKGYCVHIIDPHGDMAYDLVECLPERLDDIIFLDPLRVRFSINPFELPPYRDEYERAMLIERIIGQIVEVMKRIFGERYWGPSLNRTFQNVVRTLYLRDDRPTFEDILNVLLGKIEDESEIFKELKQELKKIPPERFDAVINKVDPFVKNALLRMLFCNKKSSIDFNELLKPKKLVIWRLAKAEITEMNMQMIGSALITKLWFYCASRPREERNPVLLVIDEFQNFAFLETLEVMIAEARKFGIGLVLSHQHTKQLTEALLGEVLGNTATKIIFRVSGEDALTLARSINMRNERNLANLLASLPDGSAVVKLRAGFGEEPIKPFEIFTLPPLEKKRVDFEKLIERMRQKYSLPAPPTTPTPPTIRIQASPQDEKFKEFLEIVDRVGDKGLREISKESGIEPRKVKQLVEEAEKKGFVKIEKVKTKGRPRISVKLTKEGRETIGKLLGREGSLLHRKMVEKVAEHFRSIGYEVEIPAQGGREEQPDLIAKGFNETIAIEVEVSADHPDQVKKNYEKNLWANRVIFIAPSEEVGWRIRNILGENIEVYVLELCD
jgi:DNA helicase HerA-like ATPase/DNA-binding MarR family transcriptional regulator